MAEQPKYKGDGVAVWVHRSSKGKKYLSIKIIGHDYINAFEVDHNKEGNLEEA